MEQVPPLCVSDVQIAPIRPRDGLLAFCSVVLGKQLAIGGIGLHSAPPPRYYRLVWPAKTLSTGQRMEYAHPITRALGDLVEQAVVEKFEEVMDRLMVRSR